VIPGVLWLADGIGRWWHYSRPARQLLGGIADEGDRCKIFVRDFMIEHPPGNVLFYFTIPRIYDASMPKVARLDSPGLLQHVMGRGIENRPILLDDQDRSSFLDRLGAAGVSIAARRGEVFLRENPGLKERLISTIDK
jgi:hypothetical protein